MALPKKIVHPLYTIEIPSSGKKIKIRPFSGKEQKLFLLAKEEPDNIQRIQEVIVQVITNCLEEVPPLFKVGDLTLFDIEYLFLQLHAKSVDSIIDFTYNNSEAINSGKCKPDCAPEIKSQLKIDDIKVINKAGKNDGKIVLYDSEDAGMLGLKLNWPTAKILSSLSNLITLDEPSQLEFLIYECLDYFYDKTDVFTPDRKNQAEMDELKEMISAFTFDQNKKIREFFDSTPVVAHELEIKCPDCGRIEKIHLQGLQDFFL